MFAVGLLLTILKLYLKSAFVKISFQQYFVKYKKLSFKYLRALYELFLFYFGNLYWFKPWMNRASLTKRKVSLEEKCVMSVCQGRQCNEMLPWLCQPDRFLMASKHRNFCTSRAPSVGQSAAWSPGLQITCLAWEPGSAEDCGVSTHCQGVHKLGWSLSVSWVVY